MAMSKNSMADFIESHISAINAQSLEGALNNSNVISHRREYLEAFCQGIIDEILANAVIQTTSGAPDGEHTGNVIS